MKSLTTVSTFIVWIARVFAQRTLTVEQVNEGILSRYSGVRNWFDRNRARLANRIRPVELLQPDWIEVPKPVLTWEQAEVIVLVAPVVKDCVDVWVESTTLPPVEKVAPVVSQTPHERYMKGKRKTYRPVEQPTVGAVYWYKVGRKWGLKVHAA